MTRAEELTRVVNNGINLLDEKGPENWRTLIDWVTLDMAIASPSRRTLGCILSQLYGRYEDGLRALGVSEPFTYGFDTVRGDSKALGQTWKDLAQ